MDEFDLSQLSEAEILNYYSDIIDNGQAVLIAKCCPGWSRSMPGMCCDMYGVSGPGTKCIDESAYGYYSC